jgi:catecholate siderophore receptor
MKKFIYIIALVISTMVIFGQDEQLEVKGKVLFKDQVNSLKPPVPLLDFPQSVNIVTDIDILNQGFREIGDIIRYTPGVNTSQGEGHRDAVVFRGVRSTADFYQDGVRDDVQYFRSLYNVDQLEIIKGSNALLFGRGGTGGLINRVSKTAQLGDTFASLNSGADTFGAADVALDGNIQVSDNIAFRLNFHADSLANHRDLYSGDRVGINPTMKFQVNSATTIDLSYEYADHERFVDRGIPVDDSTGGTNEPIEALKDFTIGTRDDNRTTLEANILKGSLNHDYADNGKLNFSVAVNDFRKMYRNFYADDYASGVVKIDGYLDETARESTVISLSNVNEFARATLAVGLEIIDTQSENIRYNTFFSNNKSDKESFALTAATPRPLAFNVNSGGTIVYNDFSADISNKSDTDIEVTSIYLTSNIDLADQWKMVLGARYDDVSIKIKQYGLTTPSSGANEKKTALSGTNETLERNDSLVSPRLGLIYKPQENMSLYLSYSESFQPRSDEQFKTFNNSGCLSGVKDGCERFDPDVFENTEVGFKYDMDSGLSLSFAYFDMEQTRAAEDGSGGTEVRALAIDGFEFSLAGPVNDTNSIRFGLSAVDATAGAGSIAKPKEVPELTYSLWWTNDITDIFDVSLGVTYQDESFIKSDPGPVLPAYTRVDMAMTITPNDNDVVRINIENLTDEIYYPHSHSTHQASVGESQNMRISYSRRF